MDVRPTATERAINTRVCAAATGEEFRHTELLPGSVPLEVNVLKPTLAPATSSLIHV